MVMKSRASKFHCPICREDVANWLGRVVNGFLDKTVEEQARGENFMVYMANSIKMFSLLGQLEMADFGTKVFESVWGTEALAGLGYTHGI